MSTINLSPSNPQDIHQTPILQQKEVQNQPSTPNQNQEIRGGPPPGYSPPHNFMNPPDKQKFQVSVGRMKAPRDEHISCEYGSIVEFGTLFSMPDLPVDAIVTCKSDNIVVLDCDVHHWPQKPNQAEIEAFASAINPEPDYWFVSHGLGFKCIYLGAEARKRASLAALSVPRDFTVEIATQFRHPKSFSTKHQCMARDINFNQDVDKKPISLGPIGTLCKEDVLAFLKDKGLEINKRYSHENCPICGDEPSDAGDCVMTLDYGIHCHRCAGKGIRYEGISKPGFVPYTSMIQGTSTVINRLAQNFVHWVHAQHELKYEYPNIGLDVLNSIYRIALAQGKIPGDPRIEMVFNENLRVLYTANGWIDLETFQATILDNDILDAMPMVNDYVPDTSGDKDEKKFKLSVNRLKRSNIKSRFVPEMRPIIPYRGIFLRSTSGGVPVETPPRLQHPVKILSDPMPLDEAFEKLLKSFPGCNKTYLMASMAAMICAEVAGGQPPAIAVTGPSGSGKGETLSLAASFLGDSPEKAQLIDDVEKFMRQIGSSTAKGNRCLVFDEFGKIRGLMKKLFCILQIGTKIDYRILQETAHTSIKFRSAMFFTCVRFPDYLRNSPEFSRRTRYIHLTSGVPNWRASSGGDTADWRNRSETNASIANSLFTHAYRLCAECDFVFDNRENCIANRIGLGHITDGDGGIDPEIYRDLYRYARGDLGKRVFIENNESFKKQWLDLDAPEVKALIDVFADGDENDVKIRRISVQDHLEAKSWNYLLGFSNQPVAMKIKIHGRKWGMRFYNTVPCARGQEILNENLPPIEKKAPTVPAQSAELNTICETGEMIPKEKEASKDNPLKDAGFPQGDLP